MKAILFLVAATFGVPSTCFGQDNKQSFLKNLRQNNEALLVHNTKLNDSLYCLYHCRQDFILNDRYFKYSTKKNTPSPYATGRHWRSCNSGNPGPIYILDGIEVTPDKLEGEILNNIEFVKLYRGRKAIRKYGTKGQYGVIELKTKGTKTNKF